MTHAPQAASGAAVCCLPTLLSLAAALLAVPAALGQPQKQPAGNDPPARPRPPRHLAVLGPSEASVFRKQNYIPFGGKFSQ